MENYINSLFSINHALQNGFKSILDKYKVSNSGLLNLSYHNAKAFATEFADRNICILGENRHRVGSDAHLTSENGKLAAFASGRPAFQQHVKHAEGSDTTPTSHVQKVLCAE